MGWHVTGDLELVHPDQGLVLIEAFVTSLRARLEEDIASLSLEVRTTAHREGCLMKEVLPADADVVARARALHREHLVGVEDRQLHVGVELRRNPKWDARPSNDLVLCGPRSAWAARFTPHVQREAFIELGRAGIYTFKRPTRTLSGVALDRSFVVGLFTEICDWVQPKTLQVLDEGASGKPWDCHLVYHRVAAGFLDDLTPRLGARPRSIEQTIADDVVEAAILGAEDVEPLACKNGLGVVAVPFLTRRVGGVYDRLIAAVGHGRV